MANMPQLETPSNSRGLTQPDAIQQMLVLEGKSVPGSSNSKSGYKNNEIFQNGRTHYVRTYPYLCIQKLKMESKDMKQDKDLMFLASCQNDDLRTLCDILTYNNKGEIRLSEQLTDTDAYLNYYPDRMNLMTGEIAEELRKFGSNTVRTFCRKGEADSYETIVRRVCKRMGVKVDDCDNTLTMERELLTTICEQTTSKLSDEELRRLADKAGIPHKSLNHQMLVTAILFAIRRNTYLLTEMIYYVTSRIASMLLGRWIGMMGMSAVSRYLGMAAGPIGWTLLAGWTLSDIASPAYRVMIPAVIMVASMRFRQTALLPQKI